MSPTPILIDCDPGIDDAVALLLAMASPELEIVGITTVAGNVTVETTQTNARCICELGGHPELKVFAGCPRPLVRSPILADHVHGENGLAGMQFPPPQMPLQPQHGVDFLIETLMNAPKPIILATLGPLTNLAVALVKVPEIGDRLSQIIMMGGAIGAGNVTSAAEFNLYADPHAAQVVFESGVDLTLIPLDVTQTALATPERRARLGAIANPVGPLVARMLGNYGVREQQQMQFAGPPLHDPCVIAYILRPELFTMAKVGATVETSSPLTLGRLVVDRTGAHPINVAIAQTIDADGFYDLLTERLAWL